MLSKGQRDRRWAKAKKPSGFTPGNWASASQVSQCKRPHAASSQPPDATRRSSSGLPNHDKFSDRMRTSQDQPTMQVQDA